MDFIIDTAGDEYLQEQNELLSGNEKPYFVDKEDRIDAILNIFANKKDELDTKAAAEEEVLGKMKNLKIENMFNSFFDDMQWSGKLVSQKKKKTLFHFDQLNLETGKLNSKLGNVDVEKEMLTAVLKPGIEQEHCLPPYSQSNRALKAMRKKEREKTKGPGWFDMKAPEMTKELRKDLEILKMRSAMDPKHFYKKNDMETLPKYFQVGRIMDSPLDHVNERLTKKERKRTMVDELLADAEFQKYNKKKFKAIVEDKRKNQYKTFMKDKRQKNKAELKKKKLAKQKSGKNKS